MAGEWQECSLGDVIELKRGYDLPQQERRPGTVPLVSSSGVTDYHAEAMVEGPGVVTGRYGTLGQVFYIKEDFWPLNTTLYVHDFKGNDPRFISYFLRCLDFLAYSDKAAVPGLNRNHLHQARVVVPTNVEEQRAIAHILGTLDDKIELNRRMSETLEAMARALFKSWFVDFEPVRAKMEGRWCKNSPLPVGEGSGVRAKPPLNPQLLAFARELRRQSTNAEQLLWRLLRNRQIAGAKFRRQHPMLPYILDFYCHEARLAIELDGGQHNEPTKKQRDAERDALLAEKGIRVLRFWNHEVLGQTEAVLETIYAALEEALPSPQPLSRGERGFYLPAHLYDLFPDRLVESELGEIPEGWEVGCVDDEFELTMGQSPPGDTYNELGNGLPFYQGRADFGFRFPKRRVYCTAPTRFAHAGDTLISVRAPVGDINMASEKCAIGRGVAAARHKSGSRSYTFYFMRSLEEVFGRFEAEGTVFGSISKADFHAIPCVIPSKVVVSAFERICLSIDSRIETNERESRTLAALRDALLPKLISGALRVKDAERFLKERGL